MRVLTTLREQEGAGGRPMRWLLENVSTEGDARPRVQHGRVVVEQQLGGRGALLEAANFGSLAHRLREILDKCHPMGGSAGGWRVGYGIPEGSQRGAEGGMGTHASGSDGEAPNQAGQARVVFPTFVARLGSWAFRRNKHGQPGLGWFGIKGRET